MVVVVSPVGSLAVCISILLNATNLAEVVNLVVTIFVLLLVCGLSLYGLFRDKATFLFPFMSLLV